MKWHLCLSNTSGTQVDLHRSSIVVSCSGADWVGFEFSRSKAESLGDPSISDRICSAATSSSAVGSVQLTWEFPP